MKAYEASEGKARDLKARLKARQGKAKQGGISKQGLGWGGKGVDWRSVGRPLHVRQSPPRRTRPYAKGR